MKKRFCILLAMMLTLCSGCLGAHSLDRYGYVSAIGFDAGEKLPYKVTLMLQNMHMEKESQTSEGFTLVSAECRNLFEAIDTLSSNLPYTLDFSRTVMLLLAQELMWEEGVLDEILDISFSRLRIRYNANVYVALAGADECLKGMENKMEPNTSKLLVSHRLYAQSTGLVPMTNLTILQEAIRQEYEDPILPVCGTLDKTGATLSGPTPPDGAPANIGGSPLVKSELKTGMAGTALFTGSRMVGLLDGENTQLLLMAYGEYEEGNIRFTQADGTETSLLVRAFGKPEVLLRLGDAPTAHVRLRFHVALEQPERVDAQQLDEIVMQAQTQLEERLHAVFLACQKLNCDAMGFGRYAVKGFATGEAWHDYDWKSAYPNLSVSFTVTVDPEPVAGRTVLE